MRRRLLGLSLLVASLALGLVGSPARSADGPPGAVEGWGANGGGQLGYTSPVHPKQETRPKLVPGITNAVQVSANTHTLVLRADGTVVAFDPALYPGGTPLRYWPTTPLATNITQVATGHGFALALRTEGVVLGWGYGPHGELVRPDHPFPSPSSYIPGPYIPVDPAAVIPLPFKPVSLAAGSFHALALAADGRVFAWGSNRGLQTGQPASETSVRVPAQVPGITDAVAIAAGGSVSLALRADGTVLAWGSTGLGDPSPPTATPVVVPGLADVVAIAAGGFWEQVFGGQVYVYPGHGLAVTSTGAVYEFGDGLATAQPVAGLGPAAGVSTSHNHSLAVMEDGTVQAWGTNQHGQLGDGTTISRDSPAPVTGLSGVSQVSAGAHYSMAVHGTPVRPSRGQPQPRLGPCVAILCVPL